jgi:DNA-binding transcriptional regulator GbsR (MarR family)
MTGAEKDENERKIADKLRMMLFAQDKGKRRVDHHSQKLAKLRNELEKS